MIFVNKTGSKRIEILANKANKLIRSEEFIAEMAKIEKFNTAYTSQGVDGKYIARKLLEIESKIEIYLYTSKNPFTSANGYTVDNGKPQVFLNTRKLNRSDASIVATLIHEAVHEADFRDLLDFHHGDNRPKGGTAPELAAEVAYKIEAGGIDSDVDSSVINESNSGYYCYRSWSSLWIKRCYRKNIVA